MKTLIFVSVVACACAAVIPVPETTLSCVISNLPVACGTDDGMARADASVGYTVTGLDTPDGLSVRILSSAVSGMYVPDLHPEMTSAEALGHVSFLGSTAGPERDGYAMYSMGVGADWFLSGAANAGVSVAGLPALNGPGQHWLAGTVPFVLGRDFAVDMFAWAKRLPGIGMTDGANSSAVLNLRLFESDGTGVVIKDPLPVPEPSAWMLVFIGAVLRLAWCFRLRRPLEMKWKGRDRIAC